MFYMLSTVVAQPDAEFRLLKEKFPNEEVVTLNMIKSIDISVKNDNVIIKYNTYEERIYLNDNAKMYDKGSIYYSDLYDLKQYESFTLAPEGKKYKKYKVDKFALSNLSNDNIFYDDSKELNYSFPRLSKGGKTVESISYELKEPHFLPVFSVSPYIPYENVEFRITTDGSIDIEILDMLHLDNNSTQFTEVKKSGRVHRTWVFNKDNPLKYESDAPSFLFLSPKLMMRIKHYDTKQGKQKVLANLDDLHEWYCNLITPVIEENEMIKSLADSIILNTNDTLKIASSIFSWVQRNIKYIAIEDGDKGLIPEMAKDVCYHRYGDCKGMSNLTFHLMKAKGLDARHCWVGTRKIPFRYTELPTPNVDNHMICALKYKNEIIPLDATHSFLPFGMPPPFIQGKELLVNGKDCSSYEVIEIPIIDAEVNKTIDSCYVKIQGNSLLGIGTATFTGYEAMKVRERISNVNQKDQLKILRGFFLKGTNKFQLDSFTIKQLDDLNLPLIIQYHFKIPNYLIELNKELYLNMNLDKIHVPSKIPVTRHAPIEKKFNSSEVNIVVLQLEEGQEVGNIPEDLFFENNDVSFSNSFIKSKNKLIRKQYFHHNALIIEKNTFESFNKGIDDILKNYNQQIVITNP